MARQQLQVLVVPELLGCIYYTDIARPDHGMLPPKAAAMGKIAWRGRANTPS